MNLDEANNELGRLIGYTLYFRQHKCLGLVLETENEVLTLEQLQYIVDLMEKTDANP